MIAWMCAWWKTLENFRFYFVSSCEVTKTEQMTVNTTFICLQCKQTPLKRGFLRILRVSRGRWLWFAQEEPINLLRQRERQVFLHHVIHQALKSWPSCLVEERVNTRQRSGWAGEDACERRRTSTNRRDSKPTTFLWQTVEILHSSLPTWAAAALTDRSSPRKSLGYRTKRRMRDRHSFRTARTQRTARATPMKAARRSATDLFAPRLDGWPPIFVSESVSWITTKPSTRSALLWTTTWAGSDCLRSQPCRGPSTGSRPSRCSSTPTRPATPARTGNATGRLRKQRSLWERQPLSRSAWQFLTWTHRVTPPFTLLCHNKYKARGPICGGWRASRTSTWPTVWRRAPPHRTTPATPLKNISTALRDTAALLTTFQQVICCTLR